MKVGVPPAQHINRAQRLVINWPTGLKVMDVSVVGHYLHAKLIVYNRRIKCDTLYLLHLTVYRAGTYYSTHPHTNFNVYRVNPSK